MSPPQRRRLATAGTSLPLLVALIIAPPAAMAAGVIDVTTTSQTVAADGLCSLPEAIFSANLDSNFLPDPHNPGSLMDTGCAEGSGTDTIYLQAGATYAIAQVIEGPQHYLGPTGTPYVTSTVVIEALGARVVHAAGAPSFRAFSVAEGGDLTLHEIHIQGFTAKGGDGRGGGGGGLGAGGAVYVHQGNLSIGWSTFQANEALGGNGSSGNTGGAGGGGGGMGGRGGAPGSGVFAPGGGGGGARGNGADGDNPTAGGGGGTVTSATFRTGGFDCGGDGGETGVVLDGDGETVDPDCRGGGGGGGDRGGGSEGPFANGGEGGEGSYGGGGGGGGYPDGDGAKGGFGAGGGAGPSFSSTDGLYGGGGGQGGFGGGGGAGPGGLVSGDPGPGGTFAGDGTDLFGGAGAGLGGAVFGHNATIVIENSTFYGNSVSHGLTSGPNVTRGQDAGGAIFAVGGALSITSSTISGNGSTGDGAGIVVYRSTDFGSAASLRLRNTIVAGNAGHDACFLANGASNDGSINNLITPQVGDVLPACPGISQTGDPGLGLLQLNGPGRTKTMAIGPGSPALDNADPTTSTADDQRGVPRPQGAGPDIGAYEFSGQGPVTTITLTPASPDGSNGWYVNPVGVTISATDADSAVAQTRCALDPATVPGSFSDLPDAACSLSNVSTDGSHVIYTASVDTEGNTEASLASASLRIDQTDPTLSPTLSSTVITVGQAGVTASPNASDVTSGVASSGCDPVDTSTPGAHTLTCTATDNAGNTSSTTVPYLVEYAILGFFEPVPGSMWRAGQTVPVKIALGDAGGTRISDADALALAASCSVTFSVEGVQSKRPQCMKYDSVTDQFVFTWKLGKRPLGDVTITVTVAYGGTSATTQLSQSVTIT